MKSKIKFNIFHWYCLFP